MEKVEKREDGCWIWQGSISRSGYARFNANERSSTGRRIASEGHRVSYELFVGPIPEGLQIDHLCRVRSCVNPTHLEAVTLRENIIRGRAVIGQCPHGHVYDEANTGVNKKGARFCLTCKRERNLAYWHSTAKHRAKQPA